MIQRQWALGDELAGFQLVEITQLDEYEGTGYLFRHIETNMEVFQLINSDRERFFSYVFRTLPNNDCGIAHILEHSVLAGSQRYPVRDPFMTLLKGSTNTFMNAMTYPDKTLYPGASPLQKDFENLFHVYTDAVFAPLLREETFWQEGVRLVCDEESCHFEGVVYNEMLGDSADHDSIVGKGSIRSLFPDTPYSFESGGNPEQIVRLDYQQFRSFYSQFYHPSNCKLFLYGDLEVGQYLSFLDEEYLKTRGSLKVNSLCPTSEPWKKERNVTLTSPMEEGQTKESASVVLSWATTDVTDPLQVVTLSTLVDLLLGNQAAPLYKALLDSGLGIDISPESGMSADFRQMPFLVGFKGINPELAEEAKACILKALQTIVKEGLDPEMVASSLKRIRFKQLEIPGGVPNGLRALNRSLRGWLYDLSPCATIESGKPLEALENELQKDSRYFEKWIKRHLLDNPHRCMVTVKPDGEHQKRQTDAIARYATQITESLDKKEIKLLQEQNQRFLQFELEGDTPEALATIPRLHLEDLPSTIRPNTHQEVQCAGQPLFIRPQFCNQIVYADFAFNVEDLSERELILLPLYTRILQTTGLGKLSYAQVATRLKHLTGDFNVYGELGSACNNNDVLTLLCRVKTLKEDFAPAMEFIQQLLSGANVGDLKQLKLVLNNFRTDFADSVTYSAHSFASLCAASVFSPIQWEGEQLSGLHQWFFLESIEEKDLPSIAQELEQLQKKLSNRRRLLLHLSCDEELVQELVPVYESFTEAFADLGEVKPVSRSYNDVSKGSIHEVQLYRLPATVSYAAWAMRTEKRGTVLQAAQILLANILTGNDLWEVIRGQGGAYGVAANADVMEEICVFSTYRDPRIAGSYRDFIQILNRYAQIDIDSGHIENALIATIGSELRPLSPSQDSILAFRRLLYHISDDFRAMRRQHLLQLDSKQLNEGAKALLRAAKEEDSYVVLSGAQLLETEKEKHPILDRPSIRLPL
ncbi:MAG: insulinase family protein [Sphaerochaetaceae bacterium]|nr:insulinase family protein [Sphaerochaetaceae bacterium]